MAFASGCNLTTIPSLSTLGFYPIYSFFLLLESTKSPTSAWSLKPISSILRKRQKSNQLEMSSLYLSKLNSFNFPFEEFMLCLILFCQSWYCSYDSHLILNTLFDPISFKSKRSWRSMKFGSTHICWKLSTPFGGLLYL